MSSLLGVARTGRSASVVSKPAGAVVADRARSGPSPVLAPASPTQPPSFLQHTSNSRMRSASLFHSIAVPERKPPVLSSRQGSGGSMDSEKKRTDSKSSGSASRASTPPPAFTAKLSIPVPSIDIGDIGSRYGFDMRPVSPLHSPLAHRSIHAGPPPKEALSEGVIEDNYILGEFIGRGAFSKVYAGISKEDHRKVAIKVLWFPI